MNCFGMAAGPALVSRDIVLAAALACLCALHLAYFLRSGASEWHWALSAAGLALMGIKASLRPMPTARPSLHGLRSRTPLDWAAIAGGLLVVASAAA
ncbi:hypothetical protein [Xanthomonas graminis]|uniref:Uncharacterized protein n=1 Tax=Xanthomonas graminis pv. poae TaxID=227946 RepID=A0A199P9Z9_9XANT|nr:hypothetical protein [Xanthomonas translucens]OAX57733.1 hypothetical protein A6R73_01220 [Xanthomonas translucens pv. poae]